MKTKIICGVFVLVLLVSVFAFSPLSVFATEFTKASNAWTTLPSVSNWTYGEAPAVNMGKAAFGTPEVTYYKRGEQTPLEGIPADAGAYQAVFRVAGTDNYSALEKAVDFTVFQKTVGLHWTAPEGLVYDGTAKIPTVEATDLVSGDTVQVTALLNAEHDNVNAGAFTYTAVSLDNANYRLPSESTQTYTIAPRAITSEDFEAAIENIVYTGSPITPPVAVKQAVSDLITTDDYDVSYETNVNAGEKTAKIKITGKRNAKGEVILSFTIAKSPLLAPEADARSFTYTGEAQTYLLTTSEAYTIAGNTQIDANTYTVTVTLKDPSNYRWADDESGMVSVKNYTFKIGQAENVWKTENQPMINGWVYGEIGHMPTAEAAFGTTEYIYHDSTGQVIDRPVTAGVYTVDFQVKETENYQGLMAHKSFTIEKKTAILQWTAPTDLVFDGTAKIPSVQVTNGESGDTIQVTAVVTSGNDNANVTEEGFTFTASALDNPNYKLPQNAVSDIYRISARPLSVADFSANITGHIYTGSEIKPSVGVVAASSFILSGDYDVTYVNHIHAALAEDATPPSIVITGKRNTTGTVTIPFTIAKATPITRFPTGLSIGTVITVENEKISAKLSDIDISAYPGYAWDAVDTVVKFGSHEYDMTFTPEDTDNYHTVTKKIAVTGKDVTPPTGDIIFNTHVWNTFFTDIEFSLYFSDSKTLQIVGYDRESLIKHTEYYLSDRALTEAEAEAIASWTEFEGNVGIRPGSRYVIYIRITDNAGNRTIINSNGLVLDDIPPTVTGIQNGGTYYKSVTFTVNDEHLDRVEVNGAPITLSDGQFTLTVKSHDQSVRAYDLAGNVSEFSVFVENTHTYKWSPWKDNGDGTQTRTATCNCGHSYDVTEKTPEDPNADRTSPVILGLVEGRTYYQSVSITIIEENLDRVEVNGVSLVPVNGKYSLSASASRQTVRAYDKAGNISDAINVFVEAEHTYKWSAWVDNGNGTMSQTATCNCGDTQKHTSVLDESKVTGDMSPTFVGIENGKTYHKQVEVTVKAKDLGFVFVDGMPVSVVENRFILTAGAVRQTVQAFDKSGHASAVISVFVEAEHNHIWSAWTDNGDGTRTKTGTCICGDIVTQTEEKPALPDDDERPALSGIENHKTYFGSVEIEVTNTDIIRVTVNGNSVVVSEHKFTVTASEGAQTIVAYDKNGAVSASYTITVEATHHYVWSDWKNSNSVTRTKEGECPCGEILTVSVPRASNAAFGGLEKEAESLGKSLHLLMEQEPAKLDSAAVKAISAFLPVGHAGLYLDLALRDLSSQADLSETVHVLEIPLEIDLRDKKDLAVYRSHGGAVQHFTALTERPTQDFADGTFFADRATNVIYLYSSRFSTYGVMYHTHQLTHIPAEAPGDGVNGNIEYWYCETCGRYYSDDKAANEITLNDTVVKYVGVIEYLIDSGLWVWGAGLAGVLVVICVVMIVVNRRKDRYFQ